MEEKTVSQKQTQTSLSNQLEQELFDEIRRQQASIDVKSRLIDNMAYQIRTLSNAIIGFSDLLGADGVADSQKEYVSEIYQAGNSLSMLVNEVLDLAKLESGKLIVAKTRIDLGELLRDFYDTIIRAAEHKGLSVQILADPDVPQQICCDSKYLLKCLTHIAVNALKFTSRGHIQLRLSVNRQSDCPSICFDLEDTGSGIADDILQTIFNNVVRLEDSTRGVLGNMDLGVLVTGSLPVTRQLVEALGGTISAASQVGKGSTFSIIIPAGLDLAAEKKLHFVPSNQPAAPAPKTRISKSSQMGRKNGRVLLVEDQASNRMVLSLLLEQLNLSVDCAEDGAAAVEKASATHYDLVLMDLMLPVMDGYEATHRLRQQGLKTPIVALSAGVMNERDHQRIAEDFNGHLAKPVDRRKLQQLIEQYITPVYDVGGLQEEPLILEYGH